DDLLARGGVRLERRQPELVDVGGELDEPGVTPLVAGLLELLVDGPLERVHADRGLGGAEALPGAVAGDVAERGPQFPSGGAVVVAQGPLDQVVQLGQLGADLALGDASAGPLGDQLDPPAEYGVAP